jgi:hypothetical protein
MAEPKVTMNPVKSDTILAEIKQFMHDWNVSKAIAQQQQVKHNQQKEITQ